MPRRFLTLSVFGLLSAVVMTAGCGVVSAPATVDGQVLINGQPAEDVQLTLWAVDPNSTGASATVRTDADGHFHITSESKLAAGEYHVTFEKFALPSGKTPSPDRKPSESGAKNVIPEPYRSPGTTSVRIMAPAKDAVLDVSMLTRSGRKLSLSSARANHASKY